jgi:hypothetical protein
MRQQVPQRDWGFGITESWRAVSIQALKYFRILDHRQDVTHRLLETETTLFNQLHGRRACDRFRH